MRVSKAGVRFLFNSLAVLALLQICSGWVQAQTFRQVPGLSFVKPFGGSDPLPQTVTIVSTGTNFDFSYTPSTSSGGTLVVGFGHWLQLLCDTASNYSCGDHGRRNGNWDIHRTDSGEVNKRHYLNDRAGDFDG